LSRPQSQPDRLTRLETTVEALSADVKSLAVTVKAMAEAFGRPNWNALAICVTIAGALCFWILRVEDKMERRWEAEVQRNNRLEREMGGALKIDELFSAGRLDLSGADK